MKLYSVWHRNGQGDTKSKWYRDANELTYEQALDKKEEEQLGAGDGWNADVEIFDTDLDPNE